MLRGSFVLCSSSLLLSLADLDLMEPLVAPFCSRLVPQPTLSMAPTRTLFPHEVWKKKKIPGFHGPFLFSESGCLPVRVVVRVSCVVLCCLVSLLDLTGPVKSSGRRRIFGRVVFLCCLCFFITPSSGSFPWAYAVRPSPHHRCSP